MPIGDAISLALGAVLIVTGFCALVALAGCGEPNDARRIDLRFTAAIIAILVILLAGRAGSCVGFHQSVTAEQQRAAPAPPAEKGTP